MNVNIEILKGKDCFLAIENNNFIESWKDLAETSQYFTLTQEYNFVYSWYKSYREKFNPIMVIGYNKKEEIIGIIPLAINIESGELSYAGDNQSEYNNFISTPEYEEEFIVESLISIKNTLDINNWSWDWMPSNSYKSWFKSKRLEKEGIYIDLSKFESPVYKLSDTVRIEKIKRNKSIKSKNNRLNRKGALVMERITDVKRAEQLIERIIKQSSFRNFALYNKMPFVRDAFRKDWYLKRIAMPNNNEHFTVLWQGDYLLACNFGSCTNDTVIIGTFTYDPLQGGNSPGRIFIIKLIEYITNEGYKYLDLTPGGDNYKESLCNDHKTLIKPIICFSKSDLVKLRLIKSSKKKAKEIISSKIKNRDINRDIVNIKSMFEKSLLSVIKRRIVNINENTMLIYKTKKISIKNNISKININKYEDLFLYKNTNGYLTKKEVIFDALKKFERGDVLYTMALENTLISFIWIARSGKKHWHGRLEDRINNEPRSIYLYDLYVNKKYKADLIFGILFYEVMKNIKGENFSNLFCVKSPDVSLS
jgi:hypothetical protein